jgi:putative transcriptional regulator
MRNVVKFKRKSEGFDLTQKQFAEAIGVSTVTIYKIENGMGCNVETALKMAKFFDCKVEEIFILEGDE